MIIPVLNEESTLEELLHRLRSLPFPVRPIFVDNASTDRTLEILRAQSDVKLIEHQQNLGYGASLKDGMAAARSDCLIIIDADLEFPPEEIPKIREALKSADVVYASRFLGHRSGPAIMPLFRILGNRLISTVFNLLYGQKVTDLYTGFKGLRCHALTDLRLDRDGFEHVLELSARLARQGHRIQEVPIEYRLRRTGVSKMRHVSETLKFLWLVLKCRFDRNQNRSNQS